EGVRRRRIALLLAQLLTAIDAEAHLVEQSRRKDGRELRGAAVHSVREDQTAGGDRQSAAAIEGRVVGKAAVAKEAAVLGVQLKANLGQRGVELLAKRRGRNLGGGQVERLHVGR